jgi:hypothetical protein
MLAFVLMSSIGMMAAEPLAVPGEVFFPRLYLVRAQVKSVLKKAPRQSQAVMAIDHVYLGPASLMGRRFEVCQWPHLAGEWGFAVGQVSICWVAENSIVKPPRTIRRYTQKPKKRQESLSAVFSDYDIRSGRRVRWVLPPKRKWEDSDFGYECTEKTAKKIEEVYRAEGNRRIDLLKQICAQNIIYWNGDLIFWAMDALTHILPKSELAAFYKDLLLKPRPISDEVCLDDALWELAPEWRCSKERIQLFHRWMTSEREEFEEESPLGHDVGFTNVYSRFGFFTPLREFRRKENLSASALFPFDRYLDLIMEGLLSIQRSDKFKKSLIGMLPVSGPEDPASIDAGFDYLLKQLRKGTAERRQAAARLLSCFIPLTKKQRVALQALFDDQSMKPLVPLLRQALDKKDRIWADLTEPEDESPRKGKIRPRSETISDSVPRGMWGTQFLRALQERLRSAPPIDPDQVQQLLSDLDDYNFRRREEASRQLAAMGLAVEPLLRHEFARTDSVEVRRRLEGLLTQYRTERLLTSRAIAILARMQISSPKAAALLQKLARGSPEVSITQQAITALEQPNYPHGK